MTTKLSICLYSDHGMPDGYPVLIKVDARAEEITHYNDVDWCRENSFFVPEEIKEIKSVEDLKNLDYDEIVILDDSMGGDYAEEFMGDINDPEFWAELDDYAEEAEELLSAEG